MRVRQIDALRGVAALLVAGVFHIGLLLGVHRSGPLDGVQPLEWLYRYGYTLVDLFFVISGFIFAHVYLERDGTLKGGTTPGGFIIARVARLYPLHLVTLAAMAALLPFGEGNSVANFILNLLMLQDSGLNSGQSFNEPSWSISVEVICYALFYMLATHGLLKRTALLLIVLGLAMTTGPTGSMEHIGRGFVGFFAGVSLWRWQGFPIPTWALCFIIAGSFLFPSLTEWVSMGSVYALTLWPALVLLALRTSLNLDWLGDRSYSIYLWHWPVYTALASALGPISPSLWAPAMVLGIACVVVVADLSYRCLETPARHAIRSVSKPAIAA